MIFFQIPQFNYISKKKFVNKKLRRNHWHNNINHMIDIISAF